MRVADPLLIAWTDSIVDVLGRSTIVATHTHLCIDQARLSISLPYVRIAAALRTNRPPLHTTRPNSMTPGPAYSAFHASQERFGGRRAGRLQWGCGAESGLKTGDLCDI
jgi:hypothetical protein